jgi:predicted SnoaL-like aldol condensation-catalyzing enzyme
MTQTIEEKNRAPVLKAFDTLFNKRDYVAAERYWLPNYIQHSAHIAPGRDGLFNLAWGAAKPNSASFSLGDRRALGRTPNA